MATISKVQVCNSALVQLGANKISNFDENSAEANACSTKWDIVRRDLLRNHPWNFAIRRRQIAASVGEPTYKYAYKFTLPAECIRLIQVYTNRDYRLEGRSILTSRVDDPSAPRLDIKYVADVEDPSEWDAAFVNVVVFRLAMELAYALPAKETQIDRMAALYTDFLQKAKSIDGSEDIDDHLDPSMPEILSVRYER